MEKIIPLISSGTEGPLGVKHLPRLWLKTLLAATGRLPEGYKDIRPGFDYIVLHGLGVEPDSARDYIFQTRSTYPMFEEWICQQPAVDLSSANISIINQTIAEREKPPEARAQTLQALGLPTDSPIKDGIMLNNLDDWNAVHHQLTPSASF